MARVDVMLPELGTSGEVVRVTVWHVSRGSVVERGEAILEVTAGAVTVDLPAPASGVLVERLVAEDDEVRAGDRVAVIETGG